MRRPVQVVQMIGLVMVAAAVVVAPALAHGTPELSVRESTVSPGGKITLSGDALGEAGETVVLTLQGAAYQATLGTVTLTGDTFDNTVFPVPKDAPAGTYAITARNGAITATAQVKIAAPSMPRGGEAGQATDAPRPRTPLEQTVTIGLVILTSALAVALLWRSRSDLTAIDR